MFPSTPLKSLSFRAKLSLLLLLCAAIVANLFPITVPLVLLYLPASIFTYLILRLYGINWAALCATLSALVVPLSVGHPYAVLWYILELAFVLWFCQQRKHNNLIFAVALYWITLGIPLIAISFYLLGVDPEVSLLISAKNCINGIANTTLACLLFQLLPLRKWLLGETEEPSYPLAQHLYSLLLGFLIIPAVIMLIGHLQGSISQMEARISQELSSKALSITGQIELLNTQKPSNSRRDLTDFLAKLEAHWLTKETVRNAWVLTLLSYDKVLISSSEELKSGDNFKLGNKADLKEIPGGVLHRLPPAKHLFMPIAGRWRQSSYLTISEIDSIPGWRLVVEKPVKPFLKGLRWSAIRIFTLLTLLTYPALQLASWVSRRISAPLNSLSQLTSGLPKRLQEGGIELHWDQTRINEIKELNLNTKEMAASLQLSFAEIKYAKQHLEARVKKRTKELHQANTALSASEQQLRDNEKHLNFLAHHDSLTGLANRLLLKDRLKHAMANAERNPNQIALLFLDLDRFKNINDSLGHDCGDKLLQVIAERLTSCCRQSDTIARLGGDEFMVMVEQIDEISPLSTLANKILQQLAQPVELNGHPFYTTASIGISVYPNDGNSVQDLLKCADTAMYRAKDLGRNNFQFYTADMNVQTHELLLLETSLREALDSNQFLLHYQPQVDLQTVELIGFEALLRWQHPEHGLLYPDRFIPLAEETGLIEPIGEWVLQTACAQNLAWQQAGYPSVRMAVNISARQFRRNDLLETVSNVLAETGLAANWLELELTESIIIGNTEGAIQIMQSLSQMGIHLTIDDFGSGYSSLTYLKRFPIGKLKIAQIFVKDSLTDSNDAAIVDAVIALAKSMHLQVIAEGVEKPEQLGLLHKKGCHLGQGFLFGEPVIATAAEDYFKQSIPPGTIVSPML